MSIEVIELGKDGTYTTMPEPDPGISTTSPEAAPLPADGLPAANGASAPPPVPATGEERLAAAPEPVEADDDEPEPEVATVDYVARRIKRLTAKSRSTERELFATRAQWEQDRAVKQAQIDTLTKMLSGAAPPLPEVPAQPTGPPQAEQFASHEDYVLAAARYGAQQEFAARDQQSAEHRQQEQQRAFQVQLMEREQAFKAQHADFDQVVRSGLAGKVSPVLQQALMLVPDGPAVAYTLARQPDLVQRLNSLPPPLVLVELGRLAPPTQPTTPVPAVGPAGGTAPPATPLPEPMAPVGGGGSMVQPVYHDGMSQREFEAYRARTSQIPYVRRS